MRIVAGKHKGLVLYGFDADNIRPTADRVRENIFNKLQFAVPDAKVLDLFGGTGAISLEFLSRGAKIVFTCDNDDRSIAIIKKNFAKAKEQLNLISGDYKSTLKKLVGNKFDIVFLDPPFNTDYAENALRLLIDYKLLENDALIVYEHLFDKNFTIPTELELIETRKYGTIGVSYLKVRDGKSN